MNFTCNCHENDVEGNYHILYRLRHNLNDQKSFRPHFCHLYFKTKIWERVCFQFLYLFFYQMYTWILPLLRDFYRCLEPNSFSTKRKMFRLRSDFCTNIRSRLHIEHFCTLSIQQVDVTIFVRLHISTQSPFKNRNRQT